MLNPLLLTDEVQQFLRKQSHRKVEEVALSKSPFEGILSKELAVQIDGLQRSQHKIPSWHNGTGLYFPKKLSLEQCSSELTAFYKAHFLSANIKIADLTAGFGVDSFAFAQFAASVTACEIDVELAEITSHNAHQFGIDNIIVYPQNGLEYLEGITDKAYDVIYLDPARRQGTQKVFKLEDCQPNILENLPLLKRKGQEIWIKLAPMLDLNEAIRSLPGIFEIHVISVAGECKELLVKIKESILPEEEVNIKVVALKKCDTPFLLVGRKAWEEHVNSGPEAFLNVSLTLKEEKLASPSFGSPYGYLYEPDVALLKAGAYKWTSQHYGIQKLHPHTHLYSSETLYENFLGKVTRIANIFPFSSLKKQKSQLAGNVIARNFPLKPDELRKKYKIAESAKKNFYFCTNSNEELIVIETEALR